MKFHLDMVTKVYHHIYIGIAKHCNDSYNRNDVIPTPLGHKENILLHNKL